MLTTLNRPDPVVPPWSPIPPAPVPPPHVDVHPPLVFIPPVWEYKHLVRAAAVDPETDEVELGRLGAEGWELVNVVFDGVAQHLYLKRQLR
ncbi:MAG: hypothetical protein ACREOF_08985 [Gemmatimonadales bacterium]